MRAEDEIFIFGPTLLLPSRLLSFASAIIGRCQLAGMIGRYSLLEMGWSALFLMLSSHGVISWRGFCRTNPKISLPGTYRMDEQSANAPELRSHFLLYLGHLSSN